MRNRILTAALLVALSAPAFAQDAEEASSPFSFSFGVVNDYAFRGVSQTNEGPALQGGIEFSHDTGFYGGIWASNVDFVDGDGANAEVDFYVGWNHELSDTLTFDASVLSYAYVDQNDYNYTELLLGLEVGDYLSFLLGYSNDVFNSGETGIYYQAVGTYPLPVWELTLNGSIGHYDLDDALGDSYQDYSVGVSKPLGPVTASLSYVHATDDIDWGDNGGSRAILSFVWEF